MKVKIIIACLLLILATGFAYAKDWHVPGDCDKIQECLDKALPGDRVLVAPGIYEENITLTSGVELIGVDGADDTTIMAFTGTVVMANAVSFRTTIKGFTIDGVDQSGDSNYGIECHNNALLIIRDVTITNTGTFGIHCPDSSPTISKVRIDNTGGGIYCFHPSSPTISNVTIDNIRGYGINCYMSSSPPISNVTITNISHFGIYCQSSSSPTISNVTIDNTGAGGIYCVGASSPTISNVTINNTGEDGIRCENSSSPTISKVRIERCSADADGISCYGSNPKIRGSVIKHNWGNGIYIDSSSLPDLGTEADPGWNSICDNADYDVVSENPTEVKAELNWWGESEPPFYIIGNVDYYPWLTSPPDSINGTVIDIITGNPIKFAFVIAINVDTKDKYNALTDGNGYYEIPDLPFGTYWVLCIKKGYKTGIKKVRVPPGEADFVLTPKPE